MPREPVEGEPDTRDAPRIEAVAKAWLMEMLSLAARFMRRIQGHDFEVRPPGFVLDVLMDRKDWPYPYLHAVVSSPTLRPDGTVIDTAGYDPSTHLLFESNETFPPIPTSASKDDAAEAVKKLLEPIREFPFVSETDRAAALAAILTPVARHAIDGPCPMFGVLAPAPGTGKSLLVDACAMIATGHRSQVRSAKLREEETDKVFTSIVLEAPPVVNFDNAEGRFGSATMAAALTTTNYSGRLLGVNQTISAPIRSTFFVTGNNIVFDGDTYRRVVPVLLDAKIERPENREFEQANLMRHIRDHRPDYYMAALTVLSAFFRAGRPLHGDPRMGSFEEWDDLVRSAVIWILGIDPCANREQIRTQADADYENGRAFYTAFHDAFPNGEAVLASQMIEKAGDGGVLHDSLQLLDWRANGSNISPQRLGKALRSLNNKVIDGLRLDGSEKCKRGTLWRVVPVHADRDRGGDKADGGDDPPRSQTRTDDIVGNIRLGDQDDG